MNPLEFLALARQLASGSRESEWRSAVSRAYYGAYHSSHSLVVGCGVRTPKVSNVHEKVPMCLQNSGDANLALAGAKLSSLRSVRNEADYDLRSRKFGSQKAIETYLQIAEEIVDAVVDQHTEKTIRTPLRAYAKNTLRWAVIGTD
jgi:uncharacterized protein (UPF0332 family)